MEHKCPKCGSVVYSRKSALCGVCGERLPKELLFKPEEKQKVESDYREARRRANEASRPGDVSGPVDPPIGGLSSSDFGSP